MSLLIKGNVHLPRSCRDCPFNYSGVCIASANCLKTKSFMKARNPDCPIIEIPTPHGALVDKEVAIETFKEVYCGHCKKEIPCFVCSVPIALDVLNDIPTIIEAEVSE